jgi:hypothetical protein
LTIPKEQISGEILGFWSKLLSLERPRPNLILEMGLSIGGISKIKQLGKNGLLLLGGGLSSIYQGLIILNLKP